MSPARTLQSKCVTICAGSDGQLLTVHEAVLLDSGSPSLQKLLQPDWKERSEGRIDWTHTDVHAVERVLTFLYYGDYSSPNPTLRESGYHRNGVDGSEERAEGSNAVAVENVIPGPLTPAFVDTNNEDRDLQSAILQSCNIRPLTPLGRCIGQSHVATTRKTAGGVVEDQAQAFPCEKHSYREPLFAHAEVYSFAKYHLLPALQDLALQRMTQTLRGIDRSVQYAEEEVSAVIEFVYDNIPANNDEEEPMQKLLSQFAAIHYTSLLCGKFEELFCRGGDFTRAVARKLSRRLSSHGVAAEIEGDELDRRIDDLETQVQERDVSIRSLNASLDEASMWGRGITSTKGRRAR